MTIAIEPATLTPYRQPSPRRSPSPPCRLSSSCRQSSPKKLHNISNLYISRRQKRTQKLNSTLQLEVQNRQLALENSFLKEENSLLKEEFRRLKDHAHSKEEYGRLKGNNARMNEENARLQRQLRLQAPLVNIGVLIRRRLLEKARTARYESWELDEIIKPGNEAAHAGDLAADAALFQLGYMKDLDLLPLSPPSRPWSLSPRIDEHGKAVLEDPDVEKGKREGQCLGEKYRELYSEMYGLRLRVGRCVFCGGGRRERCGR
jgi:hypothetical protein